MSWIPDSILHALYGTAPPHRTKPMQVLAVGISRSATESLREALHILGLEHTHHGFDTILPPYDLEEIYRLLRRKYTPGNLKLTRRISILILNTRSDLDAWYASMEATMGYFDRNPVDWDWVKSWFCAELFWVRQCMCRTLMPTFFKGSFARNGKEVYKEHVQMVRTLMKERGEEGRLLEWSVEDGWGPLCEFLGKDVPEGLEFPSGNPPQAWAERIARTTEVYHIRALRNMAIFGAGVVGVIGVVVALAGGYV
ncbi:hypothetical protein BJX66DRAFT_323912 [Aspergillus keveii]|uniref:NAD dependent epimerase/dehydratase n=1 Tax=Aspergillus keveii TaxID=714993 RepID=A0ABR4GDH7_9EURO